MNFPPVGRHEGDVVPAAIVNSESPEMVTAVTVSSSFPGISKANDWVALCPTPTVPIEYGVAMYT